MCYTRSHTPRPQHIHVFAHSVIHGQPTPYGPAGKQLPTFIPADSAPYCTPKSTRDTHSLTQPLLPSLILAWCRETSPSGTSHTAPVDRSLPEHTAQRLSKPPQDLLKTCSALLNSLPQGHMAWSQTTWLPGALQLSHPPSWGQPGCSGLRQGSQPSSGAVRPSEFLGKVQYQVP